MKIIKVTKIIINGYEIDLGENPTGHMNKKGDFYTYDNHYSFSN